MREEGVPSESPVGTLYWMREAELKHGRVAQLAGVRVCVYSCRFSVPGTSCMNFVLMLGSKIRQGVCDEVQPVCYGRSCSLCISILVCH